MEDVAEWVSERRATVVGCLCIVGVVLLSVLLPLSLKKLDFDEVGLKYNTLTCRVNTEALLLEGLHDVSPSGTILKYQTTQRSASFRGLRTLTADGLITTLDVTVTHTIATTLAAVLAVQQHYGGQAAYDEYVGDRTEWAIRNSATQFTAAQFFSQRQAFQAALFAALVGVFNESSVYSTLNLVQVVNIDLPDSVEAVLNTVTTSQQDIQNAEAERALQVREAEIGVTLATSSATITLLQAQKEVSAVELQNSQDVEAVRARYAERNAVFTNASAALGVVGDDFVRAYVVPVVVGSDRGRSIVSV